MDIACMSEINLDLNKASVKYKLHEKAKSFDKNSTLTMTASKAIPTDNEIKRGGTMIFTRGNWSGREVERGEDKLGRWTYTSLNGKADRKLTIISTYCVCDQKSHGDGNCTIYMQQEYDLLNAGRECTDPREAILLDLTKFIDSKQKKGHDVIIMGDFNSDIDNSGRIAKFLTDNKMYDAVKVKHPGQGPST